MTLSHTDLIVIKELAHFADENHINKTKLARDTNISRVQIYSIINKLKEVDLNVRR